jgi:hypothetical protein
VQVGIEIQIFLDGQIVIEPELLRHVGNARLDRLRVLGGVDPQHADGAAIGLHQPGKQAEQRCLAGAIRPGQSGEAALTDRERNIVEREHRFTGLPAKRFANGV